MSVMELSARALAAEVRAQRVTPLEVAQAARARAAETNPQLNALTLVNPGLEAEAESVAARLAEGENLPLAGVPVVIKDNIWVKGLPITQGSRLFADFIAPEDARAVARLRAAGAIILGIGTCSEFACKGATKTPLHGITRNPVDPSRTPGGSSGGSVAAVAAGMAPLALGTDAGGSSRRPPAHVGVIGFKPTQDLVPYGPGFDEPVWGISVIAPIARHMEDIQLAMSVLADVPQAEPLRGSFAVSRDFGLGQLLDPDVDLAFAAAMDALRGAGHSLTEAAPEWAGLDGMAIMPLQYAGLAALFGDRWQQDPALFDPDLGAQIDSGLRLSGRAVAQAHQAGHRIAQILRDFLTRFDVAITPTTPCAAWPAEDSAPATIAGAPCGGRDHAAFTPQANHSGCPAISLPCGRDREGLPLGLQIIAASGRDAALLALAAEIAPLLKRIDIFQKEAP
ncbi:amidase [Alloyangia pacifica]|uniref:amidase n=1 Tax=Alloyangia pacifica TaxID=311180 RepID=UPI001CD68ADC|nr:amidase [Alloyangia pacifica]MCA0997243.1 amidase [Alloyangia pacifica]